jgi:hypothetical protein
VGEQVAKILGMDHAMEIMYKQAPLGFGVEWAHISKNFTPSHGITWGGLLGYISSLIAATRPKGTFPQDWDGRATGSMEGWVVSWFWNLFSGVLQNGCSLYINGATHLQMF